MALFIHLLPNPNFNLLHFLQELKKITVILKNFSTNCNCLLQSFPMRDQRRNGLPYLLRFWVPHGHQFISSLVTSMWQTMLNIFMKTKRRINKYRIISYWLLNHLVTLVQWLTCWTDSMIFPWARISASNTWCFCSIFILVWRLLMSILESSCILFIRSVIHSSA